MKKITLKEMLDILVKDATSISHDRNVFHRFYYENGNGKFHEIVECDLMRGRFITDDQDFSEFAWELENSNIYMKD